MTDKEKAETAGKAPEKAPKSPETATGAASTAAKAPGSGGKSVEDQAGKGGEGASKVTDNLLNPGGTHGAQLEPAEFSTTGSVLHNHVASPSGPVPASLITDEKAREAAVEATKQGAVDSRRAKRNSRERISPEKAERMSPAELRAVASDRGYEDVEGGRQSVLRKFLAAQEEDEGLDEPAEESASTTIPLTASSGGGTGRDPLPAVGGAAGFGTSAKTAPSASNQAAKAEGGTAPSEKK